MNKQQFIVILSITFIVIIAWVVFGILHTKASVPISPKLEQSLIDVNPNFDQATLDKIDQRVSNIQLPATVSSTIQNNLP